MTTPELTAQPVTTPEPTAQPVTTPELAVQPSAPPSMQGARVASALDLLDASGASLIEASHATQIRDRYGYAQLAALRAAAAVLAVRGPRLVGQSRPAGGPRNLWELLPAVAPELGEWAGFFAHSTSRRWAIEQGREPVSVRDADDLVRAALEFLDLVRVTLGLPGRADSLRLTPAALPT